MESSNFVKSEKRRPKSTKRKKPGDPDVAGNAIVRETGIKSETVMSGVKNETDLTENWNSWPRNGHVDLAPSDVKPGQDELNVSSAVPGNDSSVNALPNMASSMSESMAEQVLGVNCRPGGVHGPPNCILAGPGPRMPPLSNRSFSHRPPMANLDSHFIPQQSQIFVFSTNLANEAAEAVHSGRCRSIVDFHLDQPATKQFLQAFPADAPLFPGNQIPPYTDGNKLPQKDPLPYLESDSALANVELWVQQQNASLQEGPFSPSFGPPSKQARSSKSGSGSQLRWMPSPNRGPMASSIGDFMGPAGGEQMLLGPSGYVNDGQMTRSGMPPSQSLDENLTPEQLQRREEQLAQLQKIKNMLFPEKRNDFDPRRPQGIFPGPPRPGPDGIGMMGFPRFPHPNVMQMQPPGMMEPPDGMIGMPIEPGFFGPPALPPNWESMTPEEREWFKLQHEYYVERQKSQIQMGGGGGNGPAFFSDIPPRMQGPMSPMSSPNTQGFFYQGPPGMNFPPNGHGPDFHPDFMPGMGEGVFPFDNSGPMRISQSGHDAGHVNMGPFGPGTRFPNVCKQKRRRPIGDKTDDIYRHLQPAPSPQQFCSLNLFEGQELTITRQLNLAYQEPGYPSPSQSTPTQPRKKKKGDSGCKQKMDEPKPNKNELPSTPELFSSASSLLSPLPPTNVSTPNTNTTTPKLTLSPAAVDQSVGNLNVENITASAATSGTNASTTTDAKCQLLLQTDQISSAGSSTSSSTPSTLSTNSSVTRNPSVLNNITSATLASLAKGVESLSDRMQMDMKQGGPFRNVQMLENELELSGDSSSGGNIVSLPGSAASVKLENPGTKTPQISLDSCLPSARSNNERLSTSNREVLNYIDSNSADGNDELKERPVSDGGLIHSLSSEGLDMPANSKLSPQDGNVPVINPKRSSPLTVQNITPVTSMLSPNIIGNANIQIEARAPNTIQYLPAVPCGPGPDNSDDPSNSCVTMPFDSAQLMRDGTMQPGPGPSNPAGSGPNYVGPIHGYDSGPLSGPSGMMHGYDGPPGPVPGFDGPMLVRNGLVPGFDVPMHAQVGFGPGFDGPMLGPGGPGVLPPYNDGSMHGPNGPMPISGFDGPMPNQVGPMSGFGGGGGGGPNYGGPGMHGPGCSMPGFEGQCGTMSDFDILVHGPMGPVGPHMPGYNGPVPGFGGSLPRHGGPMSNHCGGPMSVCHSGPQMMSMPPGQQMFHPSRGGPMLSSAQEPVMPVPSSEGQRVKSESSGLTRKEKDRKKRSEAAKKNSGSVGGVGFMEAAAREGRRMNPDAMGSIGPGGGRMRPGPGILRMGLVDGGMGPGFMGMGNMDGRMRPGMMTMNVVEGGMRPGMMGMDGPVRPGMMGMMPMEGGMGPGMMGLVHDEGGMRPGMMGIECEGGMRSGMIGMGLMEGGIRPGMIGLGPLGSLDGRPMMRMGVEGGLQPEMMTIQSSDGNMMSDHGMMPLGGRESVMNVGPPEPGMSASRMMSMGGSLGEGSVRPGSNAMVMSPGGNSLRPSSVALLSSDGRSRQGSASAFSGEPSGSNRPVDGSMIVPSPRMEDSRPDLMMMIGTAADGTKRMIPSGGSADIGMRPGSGLMTSLEHGDPSSLRPGSRPLSDRMMMSMGVPGEGGMRPGSAMMMGMVDGGVRPGSALMMSLGHGGDPSGMRPGSAMLMGIGGPGEGGMRPGSTVMMGVGPDGMRPGPGMLPGMGPGENGMRPNADVIGMGPNAMRPGSGMMMAIPGGPGDDSMIPIGPGDGRLRIGSEMIGMSARMVGIGGRMGDIGYNDPRLGPDGGGPGGPGGPLMGMQPRGGRMETCMPMLDMRNNGIFPNSSADPGRRPPGLESERFSMVPSGIGEEPFNAQFQQFQQQLYAKNHSQQQPSPTMEMRDLQSGSMGFDMMRNGPNFGPHGAGLVHGGPPMGMGR